jgi:hypothetical protein
MPSPIFLLTPDNRLSELKQSGYVSEDLLQQLLADHPALLGVAGNGPLLLVSREYGVPQHEGGADRWSLDHLFLTQDGTPVLVEAKRSSDPRARREVVAQMLDYAANGVAYWQVEKIAAAFHQTAGPRADEVLAVFLEGRSAEAFWREVDSKLRAGRVVMLFVADRIAPELKRIVEFLNEQLRVADILAIEVEQFVGATGTKTLVTRLVGATERALATKAVEPAREPIAKEDWLRELEEKSPAAIANGARKVIAWLEENGFEAEVTNSQDAIYAGIKRPNGRMSYVFFVRRSTGRIDTALQYLRYAPAYADETSRATLLAKLRSVSTKLVATDKLNGWPSIPLDELLDEGVWNGFKTIANEVKAALIAS